MALSFFRFRLGCVTLFVSGFLISVCRCCRLLRCFELGVQFLRQLRRFRHRFFCCIRCRCGSSCILVCFCFCFQRCLVRIGGMRHGFLNLFCLILSLCLRLFYKCRSFVSLLLSRFLLCLRGRNLACCRIYFRLCLRFQI